MEFDLEGLPQQEEEPEVIVLTLEDGTELDCTVLGFFDVGDMECIALLPDDGSEDVFLYGYAEHGEDFELIDLDDDQYEAAAAEFEKILREDD